MHLQRLKFLRPKFKGHIYLQEKTVFDRNIDFGVNVIQVVVQYPLHHVNYAHAKFEVATSNGLGGDSFTKRHYLTIDARSMSHKM